MGIYVITHSRKHPAFWTISVVTVYYISVLYYISQARPGAHNAKCNVIIRCSSSGTAHTSSGGIGCFLFSFSFTLAKKKLLKDIDFKRCLDLPISKLDIVRYRFRNTGYHSGDLERSLSLSLLDILFSSYLCTVFVFCNEIHKYTLSYYF